MPMGYKWNDVQRYESRAKIVRELTPKEDPMKKMKEMSKSIKDVAKTVQSNQYMIDVVDMRRNCLFWDLKIGNFTFIY